MCAVRAPRLGQAGKEMAGSTEASQATLLQLNGGTDCAAPGGATGGIAGEGWTQKQGTAQVDPSVFTPSDSEDDGGPEAGLLQAAAACSSPGTPQGLSPEGEAVWWPPLCVVSQAYARARGRTSVLPRLRLVP